TCGVERGRVVPCDHAAIIRSMLAFMAPAQTAGESQLFRDMPDVVHEQRHGSTALREMIAIAVAEFVERVGLGARAAGTCTSRVSIGLSQNAEGDLLGNRC